MDIKICWIFLATLFTLANLATTHAPTWSVKGTDSHNPERLPEENKRYIKFIANTNKLQCIGAQPPRFDYEYIFFEGEEFTFEYNSSSGAKMRCWTENFKAYFIIKDEHSNTDKNKIIRHKFKLTKLNNTQTIACSYEINKVGEYISIQYFLEETKHPPFNSNTIPNTSKIKATTEGYESTVESGDPSVFITGPLADYNLEWKVTETKTPKIHRNSSILFFTEYPLELDLTCHKVNRRMPGVSLSWFINDQKNESMNAKAVGKEKNFKISAVFTINREDDNKKIKCQYKEQSLTGKLQFTEIELELSYRPPTTTVAISPSTGAEKSDLNRYFTKIKRFKRDVQDEFKHVESLNAQSGTLSDEILMELEFKSYKYSCSSNFTNVITEGNRLQIKIKALKAVHHHWCEFSKEMVNLTKNYNSEPAGDRTKYIYVHTIPNITKKMEGFWNCTFLGYQMPLSHWHPRYTFDSKVYLKANCSFNVTVLAPPPATTTSTTTSRPTTISSTLSTITTTPTSPITTTSSTKSTTPIGKSSTGDTADVTSYSTEESKTRSGKCFNCKNTTTAGKNKNDAKKNSLIRKITKTPPSSIKTSTETAIATSSTKKPKSTTRKNTVAKRKNSSNTESTTKYASTTKTYSRATKATSRTETPKSTTLAAKYYSIDKAAVTTSLDTSTTTDPLTNKNETSEEIKEESGPKFLVYWGAAGAAVLVILGIVIVYGCRTCQQAKTERIHANHLDYENLTSDQSNQFPPNLEDAYASPYDIRSNVQESPYAVSSYQQNSETYSVPYLETDVSKMYAKPVPKNERQNLLYSKVLPKSQRKDQAYAQVLPKGQRIKVLPERKNPSEVTYAEIETKPSTGKALRKIESPYSEVTDYANKSTSYDNVISERSRYANANDTEYAEPAYCELQR